MQAARPDLFVQGEVQGLEMISACAKMSLEQSETHSDEKGITSL